MFVIVDFALDVKKSTVPVTWLRTVSFTNDSGFRTSLALFRELIILILLKSFEFLDKISDAKVKVLLLFLNIESYVLLKEL